MESFRFSVEKELQHQGICDASGAVALDENRFVVANDEDNILRVYQAHHSGKSDRRIDINQYFDNNPKSDEVDIEGVAQIDRIIYWISSHGRNKNGKLKPERRQFFANQLLTDDPEKLFKQVGLSYTQLLEDVLKDKRLKKYQLEDAEKLPPKEKGGLNIEGLASTPDRELLIGFRNPIPEGKALLVPLLNPRALLEQNTNAMLGEPIELDLNGLGIRSLEYWQSQNTFIVIAGAYDGSDRFALYQWSGLRHEDPELMEVTGMPSDFRPESVLFYPNCEDRFQLLSDDGSIARSEGIPCKDIKVKPGEEHPHKFFRSVWIRSEAA
ncbi:DUF3616 domain-containing protein [Altericista sp. CCNU0014]|uniref:DUF3616 domain-containing protein n=1 Tax=Altericista sp. CCNU0014 TaxID=3082949 RepID=UPI00384D2F37